MMVVGHEPDGAWEEGTQAVVAVSVGQHARGLSLSRCHDGSLPVSGKSPRSSWHDWRQGRVQVLEDESAELLVAPVSKLVRANPVEPERSTFL